MRSRPATNRSSEDGSGIGPADSGPRGGSTIPPPGAGGRTIPPPAAGGVALMPSAAEPEMSAPQLGPVQPLAKMSAPEFTVRGLLATLAPAAGAAAVSRTRFAPDALLAID